MRIAVWFSCGAASATAAYLTLQKYPNAKIHVVNNPIVEEDKDNRRFLLDVQEWLGVPIESAINDQYPKHSTREVWRKRKFMSGPKGAVCTVELKKVARYQWEERNEIDYHVMGFTAEEKTRHERFILTGRPNTLPVLIEAGMTKEKCKQFVTRHGLILPRVYSWGYPNANCIGCVKATSPGYWNHVRKTNPKVFASRAKQSRELGVRLTRVNNKRIFLDELDPCEQGGRWRSAECSAFCKS